MDQLYNRSIISGFFCALFLRLDLSSSIILKIALYLLYYD